MNSVQAMVQLQKQYGTSNWEQWSPYPQPLYDTVIYPPAGTQQIEFFAVNQGLNDPNGGLKTLEDTNLQIPRQLGQNFLWAQEIRCGIFLATKDRQPNAIATDASLIFGTIKGMMPKLYELFNRGTLTLSIDSKTYAIIDRPFVRAPAGMGVQLENYAATSAAGPAVQFTQWIQNNNDDANVFSLAEAALWIGPTQTISAVLSFPEAAGPVFTNLVDGASPVVKLFFALGGYMFKASQ